MSAGAEELANPRRWPEPPPSIAPPRLSGLKLFLLALLIGVLFRSLAPASLGRLFGSVHVTGIAGWVSLPFAVSAVLVLHEAGHLIGAVLMDFEIIGVTIGPLRMASFHGVRQIRFTWTSILSGSVSAIPKTFEYWRLRLMAVAAAGPIATLVTGAVAGLVFFQYPNSGLATVMGIVSEASMLIFVLGLVPNSANSKSFNDAHLFLMCLRNSAVSQHIRLYHCVMRAEADGTRPSQYSTELLTRLSAMSARPDLMLLAANTMMRWCTDRQDRVGARLWMGQAGRLAAITGGPFVTSTIARIAVLEIALFGNVASCRDKLKQVDVERLAPVWFQHQVQAAKFLASSNVAGALAEISRSRYTMPSRLPVYEYEIEILTKLYRYAVSYSPQDIQDKSRVA